MPSSISYFALKSKFILASLHFCVNTYISKFALLCQETNTKLHFNRFISKML